MDIVTIGSLIGITKSLVEVLKDAGRLFSGSSAKAKLESAFAELYERIEVLSVQLEQSEGLTRMVPAWLELANRMPMWQEVTAIEHREAQILDQDLRNLINDSIRDHFSATFFRSNFDRLPGVPVKLEIFRDRLHTLDRTVSTVQPGNVESLKALWPQLTTQFNDARNAAYEIQRIADDLQGQLIQELRDAAKEGLVELPSRAQRDRSR